MAGMAPPPDSTRWLMMLAESGGPTPSALQQQQPPAGAYWTTGVPLLELRQAIIDHGYSGEYVVQCLRSSPRFSSLLELLPCTGQPAIQGLDGRRPTTHQQLRHFVQAQGALLAAHGITRGDRLGVLVSNGPEAAVCLLVACAWCTCVPLNPLLSPEELRCDVDQLGVTALLTPHPSRADDAPPTPVQDMLQAVALSHGLRVLHTTAHPLHAGLFSLPPPAPASSSSSAHAAMLEPTRLDDLALVLPTAGTSGRRKVVPYPLLNLLVGSACVLSSWRLGPCDVDLNMMPLFHIGGIARNLFAPVLAGGSTVFAPSFDPRVFWEVVGPVGATWYYAAPTMHHRILQEHEQRRQQHGGDGTAKTRIRFIANAAGPLPPSLAVSLRSVFGATVLPSYGMTECMPISSPPLDYQLDRPGTSGKAVGPHISIRTLLDEEDDEEGRRRSREVRAGVMGHICVRGPPLFPGYEVPATDDTHGQAAAAAATSAASSSSSSSSSFLSEGWFDTGDLGYLDAEGYLYITGRSKEVINRGGEIIAPVDVEDALLASPQLPASAGGGRVSSCLAFAWPHASLQEAVGLVVVMSAQHSCRPSLPELCAHLSSSLQAAKWPLGLVFMDALPRGATGKPQRIQLASRLGLPELKDHMSPRERLFEAHCPPAGAGLHVSIPCRPVDAGLLPGGEALPGMSRALESLPGVREAASTTLPPGGTEVVAFVSMTASPVAAAGSSQAAAVLQEAILGHVAHSYLRPDRLVLLQGRPLPRCRGGSLDWVALREEERRARARLVEGRGPEGELCQVFGEALGLGPETVVGADQDFFAMGGDSLRAGKLVSLIRRRLGVTLPVHVVYSAGTAARLQQVIAEHQQRQRKEEEEGGGGEAKVGEAAADQPAAATGAGGLLVPSPVTMEEEDASSSSSDTPMVGGTPTTAGSLAALQPHSQTRAWTLAVQLVPLLVLYPLVRVASLSVFMMALVQLEARQISRRTYGQGLGTLLRLGLALSATIVFAKVVLPLVAIVAKWVLLGRCGPGRWRLWGNQYLRFWLVDQTLHICGRGVFSWFDGKLLPLYLRLLGASVAEGVRVHPQAHVNGAMAHLVSLRREAVLDCRCTVRPVTFEAGAMVADTVVIGECCVVGCRAIVAPGSSLPPGTIMPPLSSSYELPPPAPATIIPGSKPRSPSLGVVRVPWWLKALVGYPVLLLAGLARLLPRLVCVGALVVYLGLSHGSNSYHQLLTWFASPQRGAYYLLVRLVRVLACPPVYLAAVVLLKRTVIGRFRPGPRTPWSALQSWLMGSLMQGGDLGGVAVLLGRHFEGVGAVYRALGARVGRRIYWPGSGLVVTEYDLLDVGDDVVFGSRSLLLPGGSSLLSRDLRPISISAGAMVADRCVLLGGSRIGRNAVLGSGGICPADFSIKPGSVWVGAHDGRPVLWSHGQASDKQQQPPTLHHPADTARPPSSSSSSLSAFGRAVYAGRASFRGVMPAWLHMWVNVVMVSLSACYWALPLLAAFRLTLLLALPLRGAGPSPPPAWSLFLLLWASYSATTALAVVLCLSACLAAKWVVVGWRQPGPCSWDESPYCQRWKVLLAIEELRRGFASGRGVLEFLRGSAWLVWYFRAQGCRIGRDVCLYPCGADPMMTEPDLVEIGDEAVVDDASLIAHINTRGHFELRRLHVGKRCVMRAQTRLLSGASLEDEVTLLEHTLITSGEVAEAGSTWQGWPAAAPILLSPMPPSTTGSSRTTIATPASHHSPDGGSK